MALGFVPVVGSFVSLKDLHCDIQNWEWTFSHTGIATLDAIGIIPEMGGLTRGLKMAVKLEKVGDATRIVGKMKDTRGEIIELIGREVDGVVDKLVEAENRMRIAKILDGDINAAGKAIGGHSQDTIGKIIRILEDLGTNAQGVRKARIAVLNENGEWVEKSDLHTFFPKDWSRGKIIDAIESAFKQSGKSGNGSWSGEYEGIILKGFTENGFITSAYPFY